ncbi:hypothetical protein [Embleya sp. NPDC059237]|uniref:hypothetical protein n=1 Tax=Embleya sp. NPDC059237 TaxID=3346784 RepID=UPI003695605F
MPAASERVAVVQPREGGRSPYLCPVAHLVVLDLGSELAGAVRELWRLDALGRQVGVVALPILAGRRAS